ncbi:carboxylesterase, partial [Rhyzopertha dominica]
MYKVVLLTLTVSFIYRCYASGPVVETKLGKVRGQFKKSYEGKTYSAFEGIPYAKPPVGNLRFEPPQKAEPWDGVLEANAIPMCTQRDLITGQAMGKEDCLYMNVYVPSEAPSPNDNRHVFFHVHGGAFMAGFGNQYVQPDYLMDRDDVIFITFSYRLGPLGFLSTEDEVVPGNMGMKDQVFALKWVQENIACFGGNPESVTLDGFSAGAGSTHLHYFSPLSKGLFHRGYSHSGAALDGWAIKANPLKYTHRLAEALGCSTQNSKSMIACMKEKSDYDIIKSLDLVFVRDGLPGILFSPVVETIEDGAFLYEHPLNMLVDGRIVSDVPWINSFTTEDGMMAFLLLAEGITTLNTQWNDMLKYTIYYDPISEEDELQIAKEVKKFYFGKETITNGDLDNVMRVCTAKVFAVDGILASRLQSKAAKSPVYHILYDFRKTVNLFESFLGAEVNSGVGHGDDLIYVYASDPNIAKLNDTELEMKNIMLDMTISYVKTGVPKIRGVENWLPAGTSSNLTYVRIKGPDDIALNTEMEFFEDEMFWHSLPIKQYQ